MVDRKPGIWYNIYKYIWALFNQKGANMSEKRRDNKNRILQTGESQRKDGRYCYKYTDNGGNPQFIYSWRLLPSDRVPKGKRDDISLREKEKEIRRDLEDGIDASGRKMTVCELYEKFIRTHNNIKDSSVEGRERLMKRLKDDKLGNAQIGAVKPSDAKEWAIRQRDKGLAFITINNDKRSLSASFYMAVQDDLIRKNPFDFKLDSVIEDTTESKVPLSPEQAKSLLDFMQGDKVYKKHYNEFVILLGTGLRISELCGLTVKDVDMDNRKINVDHQLLKRSGKGLYIETPKTESGVREIPMSPNVYEAFQHVLEKRRDTGAVIDGYHNFLFCTGSGCPKTVFNFENVFRRLAVKYNGCHEQPLPKIFTPHVLRHTFCTNMANAGMNPKALQYIMGHKNITMTLNYYAHATYNSAKEEMERLTA